MDGEQHRPELSTGHRVTYLVGQRTGRRQLCRRGVVTGSPVVDEGTEVTWVPVQVDGTHDEAPQWITADAIIDVVSTR
ncbi:hypothetical protein [Amycolatopsis benzoatilytica]|uniref:hypothetical protein n=1 Tax=Amycolatopsis benzoatilytica TaxID=346045 RepID=UPI0003739CE0|nr:hypothetical protein [Amycolatopsis benzoatilytica]